MTVEGGSGQQDQAEGQPRMPVHRQHVQKRKHHEAGKAGRDQQRCTQNPAFPRELFAREAVQGRDIGLCRRRGGKRTVEHGGADAGDDPRADADDQPVEADGKIAVASGIATLPRIATTARVSTASS